MMASPLIGFIFALCFMYLLLILFYWITPHQSKTTFGRLQIGSAAFMAFSHGSNDAQKTMGIIALALFSATTAGTLHGLPDWLNFLHTPKFEVHGWVIILCAITMALGTSFGGWRIIRTMGHRMVKLQPVHGFAAETSAAVIINVASHYGIPVSTTHVIATCIMGVGATKRLSAVKWGVVGRMVWAWILTLPVTAALAYGLQRFFMLF
jgi:PiT family inorganic phosphate transporter